MPGFVYDKLVQEWLVSAEAGDKRYHVDLRVSQLMPYLTSISLSFVIHYIFSPSELLLSLSISSWIVTMGAPRRATEE
jgi:hypothetical protein